MPLWIFQTNTQFLYLLVDNIKIIKYYLQHGTMYYIYNKIVCLKYTIWKPPTKIIKFGLKLPLTGHFSGTLKAKVYKFTQNVIDYTQSTICNLKPKINFHPKH